MLTQWHNGGMNATTAPFKNKTLATLLASLGGSFGLHRFYLEGPSKLRPWLYPAFCFTLIPAYAGFIEALVFGLTPDAKWDARWNAASGRNNDSGWAVVIIVALTLLFGAGLLVAMLAIGLGAFWGAGETW